jgi:hypothetical protein
MFLKCGATKLSHPLSWAPYFQNAHNHGLYLAYIKMLILFCSFQGSTLHACMDIIRIMRLRNHKGMEES